MTQHRGRKRSTVARALALGLGALLLLGQLRARLGGPMADSPLPPLPEPAGPVLAIALGLLLILSALRPRAWSLQLAGALLLVAAGLYGREAEPHAWRALALACVALALLAGATGRGALRASEPGPEDGAAPGDANLEAAASSGTGANGQPAASPSRAAAQAPPLAPAWATLTLVGGAMAWPLLLMLEAGRQGPREDAPPFDAMVVLGARTYADGRPSLALTDRVRTGSQLVVAAKGDPMLWLSGGPGDGDLHETQAMARLARDFGVAPGRIGLDPKGLDTRATARAAAAEAQARGWRRVVAVSHAYHVPRVRQAFRDEGLVVRGVAAVESRRLARRAQFLIREVAAWWLYWLRGFRPS